MREDPLAGPLPGAGRPPPGAFPPRRCAATGSGSAWKGPGAKVARGPGRELYSAPSPTSPLPGAVDRVLAAPSSRRPPPPHRGAAAGGRGPSPPARLSTGADCPQCAPDRVASPGRGSARDRKTGARGLRRCRQPTRPVLKHGPRSLTRARVRGCSLSKPRGAMKVRAGARRPRWDPGPRLNRGGSGRTTGPSRPLCRGGGA